MLTASRGALEPRALARQAPAPRRLAFGAPRPALVASRRLEGGWRRPGRAELGSAASLVAMLSVDRRIGAAWACTTGGILYFVLAELQGGLLMAGATLFAFMGMLPLLDTRSPTVAIMMVGYISSSIIMGLEAMDLAFDLVIVRNYAPALGITVGGSEIHPLQVAWIYYHTMLTTVHINVVVTFCVACLALGATALAARAKPEDYPRWKVVASLAVGGSACYVCGILPRYAPLIKESTFNANYFSRWHWVLIARVFTIICVMVGQFVAFPLLKTPFAQLKAPAGGGVRSPLHWFRARTRGAVQVSGS